MLSFNDDGTAMPTDVKRAFEAFAKAMVRAAVQHSVAVAYWEAGRLGVSLQGSGNSSYTTL
jgi:hypothetical protein